VASVAFVAPATLVQVTLSGELCHWKVYPAAAYELLNDKVKLAPEQTLGEEDKVLDAGKYYKPEAY